MIIIDGRKIRDDIFADLKIGVASLPFTPVFCDVLVGDDPASRQYVNVKARAAESVGIKFQPANFQKSITTDDLLKKIKKLNVEENMCGIIVQLPLPAYIDKDLVLDCIDPRLDVDALGKNTTDLNPPTALACMAILDSLNIDLENKKIVILGQGLLVGRPVFALLRSRGLSPIAATNETENKELLIKEADIIISGIGKGKYITGDMIKEGAVLIDAGTSESEGAIVGDVDLESVKNTAGYLSPVPGGVGPVTVAMLLKNVLKVAKNKK